MLFFSFNRLRQSIYFLFLCLLCVTCTKKPEVLDGAEVVDEYPILDETVEASIPHMFINIDNSLEVVDKENYLKATIQIEGNKDYQDVRSIGTRIRGRGNSTWLSPKKPYRLKLDNKHAMCGLSAAKDWVLLANYNDYTLMTAAVAMKMGKQLNMPFTNDIIPIDLTVNGVYRGSYNLTQQVEVHENRVNVGDDGVLWELDTYFDEDWKFKSSYFELPLMLKYPDIQFNEQFEAHKAEFQELEDLISHKNFPKTSYGDRFDKQQFVNYMIVQMLVGNHEVTHPKSVFIHKKNGGKFTIGPLWDYDYAFGFSEEYEKTYFNYVDLSVLKSGDIRVGSVFFRKLMSDPETQALFISSWK